MSWFKGFDSPTPKKRHICPEYKSLIMLWSWCVPLLQLVNRGPSKHGAMGLIMPKIRIQPFLHSQTSDFNAWDPIWVISVLWLLSRLLTFLLGLEIVKIIIKKPSAPNGAHSCFVWFLLHTSTWMHESKFDPRLHTSEFESQLTSGINSIITDQSSNN